MRDVPVVKLTTKTETGKLVNGQSDMVKRDQRPEPDIQESEIEVPDCCQWSIPGTTALLPFKAKLSTTATGKQMVFVTNRSTAVAWAVLATDLCAFGTMRAPTQPKPLPPPPNHEGPYPPPPGVAISNTSPGSISACPICASSSTRPSTRNTRFTPGCPACPPAMPNEG